MSRCLTHLQHLRQCLQARDQHLHQAVLAGEPIAGIVHARSQLMDELLCVLWQQTIPDLQDAYALVAVGGYGRQELHPYSDIDIIILLTEPSPLTTVLTDAISTFVAALWDMGLQVGHSVRDVAACLHEAQEITVATQLLEARLVIGNADLFKQLTDQVQHALPWSALAFLTAKRNEQTARHQRFNDAFYNLEPHVKKGPGGLRDLQTILWIAKRVSGISEPNGLVDLHWLTRTEYQELTACRDFLWRVRWLLHMNAGRAEERLLFDAQRHIAAQLNFVDQPTILAVEQLMRRYYQTLFSLNCLNELLLAHFEQHLLPNSENVIVLDEDFQIKQGFLEVIDEGLFERKPHTMFTLFTHISHPKVRGIGAQTARLLRLQAPKMNHKLRHNPQMCDAFMVLLRQPNGTARGLQRLHQYRLLGAWIPEIELLTGHMQFDLFHMYTVDQHTLMVVRYLRRMCLPRYAHEIQQPAKVMRTIEQPERVYIAALFHDIGKGRGGGHAQKGAADAVRFCQRHRLSESDTALISWLVSEHLLMSLTAQKQDISHPDVIHAFAQKVGSRERLDCLYVLTTADIAATNLKLWNRWRECLLDSLYQATLHCLGYRSRENAKQTAFVVLTNRYGQQAIQSLWKNLDEAYFERQHSHDIIWHSRMMLKKRADNKPMVLTRNEAHGTEILIYVEHSHDLLLRVTRTLERLRLNTLSARVLLKKGAYILESYIVQSMAQDPQVLTRAQHRQIRQQLSQALSAQTAPARLKSLHSTIYWRRWQHFSLDFQLAFGSDTEEGHSVLELCGPDRPGLLADFSEQLHHASIMLQHARINTFGERVEDVFYLTLLDGQPLKQEHKDRLLYLLNIALLAE